MHALQSGPKSGPRLAQNNTDKAMISNRSKADPHANRSERRLRALSDGCRAIDELVQIAQSEHFRVNRFSDHWNFGWIAGRAFPADT